MGSRVALTDRKYVGGSVRELFAGDNPVQCLQRAGSEETQKRSLIVITCVCMFLVAFPWYFEGYLIRHEIPLAEKSKRAGRGENFSDGSEGMKLGWLCKYVGVKE